MFCLYIFTISKKVITVIYYYMYGRLILSLQFRGITCNIPIYWNKVASIPSIYLNRFKERSFYFLLGFPWLKVVANNEAIEYTGFIVFKLKSSLWKFYGRHHDMVSLYGVCITDHYIFFSICSLNPRLFLFIAYHGFATRMTHDGFHKFTRNCLSLPTNNWRFMFLLRVHDLLLCYLYLFAHTGVQHKVIDEEGTTCHSGVLYCLSFLNIFGSKKNRL